ncbi:pilus assembly protein PilM [Candidatus Omnitrophota bacterium]
MFKKKKNVGVFFSSRGVSIVELAEKGRAKKYIFTPYPKDITKPSDATTPKDNIFNVFLDNEEEIIAFLSKSIRESRIDPENSDIVVCVPNRDLIVRFFEIPLIPRKEINTSIGFEIKKYIPFKMEDITYDYQTHPQKNIIEVLFVGIKKEDLEKYHSMLTQLKVKALAIEPAQFSLLRLLKIEKILTSKESVVVIEIEKEESTISIVDNFLPCFSRDIRISGDSESAEVDMETLSFRLVNEVRVSMDYFRRQFLKKGIDRILVLSKEESKELINNFNKELGIPVEYHNPDDIFGSKEEYSLNLAKAMGASLRIHKPSSLTINLAEKEKVALGGLRALSSPIQKIITDILEVILDIPKPLIIKMISFALVLLLVVFFWGAYELAPARKQLSQISKEASLKLTGDLEGLDTKKLKSFKNKLTKDLSAYRKVFNRDFIISEKLMALSELLPEGVWLDHILYDANKKSIILKSIAYREDDRDTSDKPYVFVANLKDSPLFSNNVASISVTSLRSSFQREYKVQKFDVRVKLKKD